MDDDAAGDDDSVGTESSTTTSSVPTSSDSSGDGTLEVCGVDDVREILVRNACTGCHSDGANLNGGGIDLVSEGLTGRLLRRHSNNATCPDDTLVDDAEPRASLLLRAIAPDRYTGHGTETCLPIPMPLTSAALVPQQDVDCIEEWIDGLDESDLPEPEKLVALDAFTVANKVKFVLHGGALTQQELDAVTALDGSADPGALADLVDDWMQTPSYQVKRRQFLELTLQQQPADDNYFFQYRNTVSLRLQGLRSNLRSGMIRTAERIIDSNEDFRSIVTTRDWEVTTLFLLALKMADNPPDKPDGKFRKDNPMNDMREVLREDETAYDVVADAEDWRTVTLVHDPSSDHMTVGEDFMNPVYAQELRNVPDGGTVTLRAPRIGFFTTPAFFQTWLTNYDNEFRVTTNQALLVALGKTFTPGDPTPRNVGDEGVDLHLFPTGTECYGCHKQLEGMRAVWLDAYDPIHTRQYLPEEPVIGFDFSFAGHSTTIATLDDWAETVASHPAFAKAWVLKLCQWASSSVCDEHGAAVKALAEDFADSGYDFNHLVRSFFSSDLVTKTSHAPDTEYPGAQVSIARYRHYCHAIKTRLDTVREATGRDPTSRVDICNRGQTQPILASSIPSEQWSRGQAEFHQPSSFGAMSAVSFQGLCALAAEDAVGPQAILPVDEPSEALEAMVSQILGMPAGSEPYQEQREALQVLYDTQIATPVCPNAEALSAALADGDAACGMGVSEDNALENVWNIVCQSPSLTGVGL